MRKVYATIAIRFFVYIVPQCLDIVGKKTGMIIHRAVEPCLEMADDRPHRLAHYVAESQEHVQSIPVVSIDGLNEAQMRDRIAIDRIGAFVG